MHTMFAPAFDERRPACMSRATNGGEVYPSLDAGDSSTTLKPPPGDTQVYALTRLKIRPQPGGGATLGKHGRRVQHLDAVAREVADIERQKPLHAADVHRGDEARVMDLHAKHTMLHHKALPFAVHRRDIG